MQALKISIIPSIVCALILSITSLLFYFGDWNRLIFVFLFGAFVGLVAAPEFRPKAFVRARLYQLIYGALSGLMLGFLFNLSGQAFIAVILLGGVLGWFTKNWLKYVPVP